MLLYPFYACPPPSLSHLGFFMSLFSLTASCTEGVTFLALGNGAPDIFSAMAAFSHPHTAGLAVGALFGVHTLINLLQKNEIKSKKKEGINFLRLFLGAGIFVTTVVAGSVSLFKPFAVASRPFLRDVIFYMVAVFWTFLMLYRGTTTLGETLGRSFLGKLLVFHSSSVITEHKRSLVELVNRHSSVWPVSTLESLPILFAAFQLSGFLKTHAKISVNSEVATHVK